ncbi:MAG: ubiquinol-cytochrome c reductase iron-sulfur subunit N-terminal domain-containing protein [Hyphomicrobiaceae bacterium]|nr:ubiquinol-cytochrome c reductase iron-sulfur subunit N-terminal domain-containing protein [Hyphomicrobiaceae bacterium]
MLDPVSKPPPRRSFIVIGASAFAGIGLAIAAWPMAASLAPNESSPRNALDVDVSGLPTQTFRLISLQGEPVLLRQWSKTEPWIVTQGNCSHCACMLKPMAHLAASADEWILCPCCASRFQFDGGRLSGPAQAGLKAIAFQLAAPGTLRIGKGLP